jgi:hypothetical protein
LRLAHLASNNFLYLIPIILPAYTAYEEETSAYKTQRPENHPEERIQHSEHGESLKSGTLYLFGAFHRVYIYICMYKIHPVFTSVV